MALTHPSVRHTETGRRYWIWDIQTKEQEEEMYKHRDKLICGCRSSDCDTSMTFVRTSRPNNDGVPTPRHFRANRGTGGCFVSTESEEHILFKESIQRTFGGEMADDPKSNFHNFFKTKSGTIRPDVVIPELEIVVEGQSSTSHYSWEEILERNETYLKYGYTPLWVILINDDTFMVKTDTEGQEIPHYHRLLTDLSDMEAAIMATNGGFLHYCRFSESEPPCIYYVRYRKKSLPTDERQGIGVPVLKSQYGKMGTDVDNPKLIKMLTPSHQDEWIRLRQGSHHVFYTGGLVYE